MSSSILQVQPTAAPAPGGGTPPGELGKAAHLPAAPQRVEGAPFDAEGAMQKALKDLGLPHDESLIKPGGDAGEDAAELAPGMESEGSEESALESQTQQAKPKDDKPVTQDRLSRGFAKLKDMEERLDNQRSAFNTEKQSFQTERQAFQTERETWNAQREAWKQNPLAAIEDLGWNIDRFVKFCMSDGQVPQEVIAHQLTENLKSQTEKTQKELEELKRQKTVEEDSRLSSLFEQKTEARVEELLGKGESYLPEALEKFPMVVQVVDTFGRAELLADVRSSLIRHFQQTGQAVDPIRALSYLDSAYRKRFPKMAAALGRNPAQPRAVQSAESVAQASKPLQLTNRETSDIGIPSEEEASSMTPEEREERALRLFRGH